MYSVDAYNPLSVIPPKFEPTPTTPAVVDTNVLGSKSLGLELITVTTTRCAAAGLVQVTTSDVLVTLVNAKSRMAKSGEIFTTGVDQLLLPIWLTALTRKM